MAQRPTAWVAIAVFVVSVPARAQDGLRSASLPERGPDWTASGDRDVFRVPPDFYRRVPDPDATRLFFPTVLVPAFWPAYEPRPERVRRHRRSDRPVPSRAGHQPSPDAVPASSVPLPPAVPGRPKTFYVIPGCYAGDRLPEPERLGPGCDRSKLKVIPPA